MADKKQKRVNRVFGRLGARLWGLFTLGALATVVVVALMIFISVNTQREQTFLQQQELAKDVSLRASSYMARLQNAVQTAANVVPLSPQSPTSWTQLLYDIQRSEPAFMDMAVVGPDGIDRARLTRDDYVPAQLIDRSNTEAFKAALKRQSYTGPIKSLNGYPVMELAVPIVNEAGPVGAVTALVDLSTLWDVVANVELGQRGYAYLVDGHGNLIAYRDVTALASGNAMNAEAVMDAITSKAEPTTSKSYANGMATPGEEVLAYYKSFPIGSQMWYAIVEQPTSDAFARVNTLIAAGAALMLASAVAIVLVGLYVWRRVMRPISVLRQGATQLASGKFEQQIVGVKTGDELEFLADEFNDLASKLQAVQTSTAEAVREREEQYQTAQQRVREMSTLLKAGRAITSLDLENVLDNLARESAGTAGADRCAIFVLDEGRQLLVQRGWWDFEGLPKPEVEYGIGEGVVGWTARENKPLFLANAQADQRFIIKGDHDRNVAAVMNLPLVDEGAVVGVLQVSTRPGTPAFTREEQRLLSSFADQAAVAIKNAQLYEEERRRAQEMALVAEINRTISESLNLDRTLNAILASLRSLISYDLAEINLWDDEEKVLRTRGRGADPQYEEYSRLSSGVYRLDQGVSGWLARQRKPLLIDDVTTGEVKLTLDTQQLPIKSVCAAPLIVGDQLVGTIELASLTQQAFTEGNLATLQTVASQSAVAIQNAQLFAETRRRVDESATLFRISSIAASALPSDELLHRIMAEVGTLMDAELGLAMLYSAEKDALEPLLAASFGGLPDEVRDFRIDASHPAFAQSIFRRRVVFRSEDALNDVRVASFYRPFVQQYQVRSLLIAPLIVRDRVIGEIYVAKRVVAPFTDEDQQRLSTVVTLLAEAIENFRLSAEQQRRMMQLGLLSEIGRSVSAALDENEVLDALYEQLNRVIDARTLHVARYQQERDEIDILRFYENGQIVDLGSDHKRRSENTLTFYVCRNRKSLLLHGEDIAVEAAKLGIQPRVTGSARTAKAWMGTPMISGDNVLGMIAAQSLDDPAAYDQNDLNLLQSIANQAGVALVNANLYAETQRRLTQLSQLSDTGRVISSALQEDQVLDVLYEQINHMIDARTMYVAFYDEPEDEITFRRLYEEGQLYESGEKRRGGTSLTFYVCRKRQPLLLHGDVPAEARRMGIETQPVATSREAVVWMGAPMVVGERVLGIISIQDFEDEFAYDESDLNLLQAIANQTAVALANARLYQLTDVQLSERVVELTALSAIGQELNATLEPDRIFSLVLTEALTVTGADYGFLAMIEEETGRLTVRATQGLTPEEAQTVTARDVHVGEGITGRAAQTGEPILVNDVRRNADYVELRTGILSEVAVPIRYAQSIVGVLNLESRRLDAFTGENINFLNALAAQAAIAIGNAQRLEEYKARGELLRHRAEQLTNLFEIGQAFRTDQPLDQVLDEVVHAIQETVGFNVVLLSLLQGEPPHLHRVAAAGIPMQVFETLKQAQQPWSVVSQLLLEQFRISQSYYLPMEQREITEDLDTYTSPGGDRAESRTPGMWHGEDLLVTPLRGTGDKVLGIISVDEPVGGRVPDRATIETLELFANQAAIAVENAYLFSDLQQRLNDLTLFNEVGRSISAKLDLEALLSTVLEAACKLVGADHATIFLRDAEANGKFVPRQTVGYNLAEISTLQFGPGEGLVGIIIDDPRGIIVPNIEEEPRFVWHESVAQLKSVILVPLSVAGQLIGVLSVDKPIPNSFTNTDLVILSTLADQAAVAIDNARLFEAEREQRTLAETLRELSAVLSRTLNVNEVLDQMLAQVGRVVSYDAANIMLVEDAGRMARVVRSHGYDRIEPGLSASVMNLRFSVRETVNLQQVVETNQPLIINDTHQFNGWIEMPPTAWVRSYLCAPLVVRNQVLGFLNLDSATPLFFTNTDADRLLAFAAQSAVAIDNARLFEETRRNLQDQLLLYQAGQAISSTLEYEQVLEIVSSQLMRATNAQIVLIQEWNRTTDQVKTIYQKLQTTEGLLDLGLLERPFAPTDYLKVAQYLRDRRSISLRVNDDDLDTLLRARMQDAGLLWTVEVPLVAGAEVLGLVRLGDTRFDRELSDSEVQLIETLINQAAIALNNARLHDQVVRFTQELEAHVEERTHALALANDQLKMERDQVETLFRIASELSTSLDLDRVLNRALELVVTAAGATHGSILLVDPQTDVLVARAVLGGDKVPAAGRQTPFRRGEGLAGWCIINRQAAIVADVREDPRWIEHTGTIRRYRSALVVPLSVTEEVLGAMLLLHNDVNYFNDVHLRMVSAASSQVATAINNAELYRYIREQAELLGGMLRAQQVESSKSQAILESVADGVMVSDANGRVILFNAAAEGILSVKRDDVIGRPIDDMLGLYSGAGARWIQQVREWHASPEARRRLPVLSHRLEFKGEKRFITVTVAPVTMTDEYLGSVSVFRDITAEVEADQAKTEFISTVSHELRTPMTSIKGYADLLLIGAAGPVNENQQRFLSVIKSNADRLSILVNDLLDISRIESGRVKLEIKPISIESVIESVAASLHNRIEDKKQTLRVQLPAGILPRVYGDRDRLIQILTNLLSNAHQYTSPGGTLTISVHEEDANLQVDVSDTGIGIAPENQSKVFDRFFRADDPIVQEFSGTGLGLSIVKSLVEMHEGRIWVQSEPGVGTTFSFTLRMASEAVMAEQLPAESTMTRTPEPELLSDVSVDGRHVLVVEDDRDIAELIGRHLTGSGYQVSVATRAQDALEKARMIKPSLITLDIYLPDADGFEVLQQLKTDPATADIPVVIVSVMGDQREGLRLGAVDYLTKPIDPGRLIYSVNRVLQGPGKILVVDDDRDTRDLLQTALEQRGFSVVLTSSGKRALTLARQEHPNLILLDLKLPGMDGYEVLQRLKGAPETADIPVVIITGSLTDEELKQHKLLSLGAARFMTKPFAVDELVYEIGVLVTNRALVESS